MVRRLRQYGLEENVKQERRKFGFKILVATEYMWENIGDIIGNLSNDKLTERI